MCNLACEYRLKINCLFFFFSFRKKIYYVTWTLFNRRGGCDILNGLHLHDFLASRTYQDFLRIIFCSRVNMIGGSSSDRLFCIGHWKVIVCRQKDKVDLFRKSWKNQLLYVSMLSSIACKYSIKNNLLVETFLQIVSYLELLKHVLTWKRF